MSIYEHKLHKCNNNNGDYYYSNLYTVCSGVKNMQWLIEDHALPIIVLIKSVTPSSSTVIKMYYVRNSPYFGLCRPLAGYMLKTISCTRCVLNSLSVQYCPLAFLNTMYTHMSCALKFLTNSGYIMHKLITYITN